MIYFKNYLEARNFVGKNKFLYVLGWIFIVTGILSGISSVIDFLDHSKKFENYTEKYVYSDYGLLSYEESGEQIYIYDIYNTDNEKITINIPNQKTVIMYINNDNIHEGVYFNLNNSIDSTILQPEKNVFATFFLITMGLVIVLLNREYKSKKLSIKPVYSFYLFLFCLGFICTSIELNKGIDYLQLKLNNNVTTAYVYSEIYMQGGKKDFYKPVSYYHVDNQKYLYIHDYYIKGYLEDDIGKTFELYYDIENPSHVIKAENPINLTILFIGILFVVIDFPFVFMPSKMNKRVKQNLPKIIKEQNGETEWKI